MSAEYAGAVQPLSGRVEERLPLLAGSFSWLFETKATDFLLTALPQFEGSPGLQCLIMSCLIFTSGTATILVQTMLGKAVADFFCLTPPRH